MRCLMMLVKLWMYPKRIHWIHHNADVYGFMDAIWIYMDAIYHMSIASRNPKKLLFDSFAQQRSPA